MDNVPTDLSEGVNRHLKTLYVGVPAILTEVKEKNGQKLGIVYKKDDPDISADEVPMFSLYGGDGYGEEHALSLPEEGIMLCLNYQLDESRAENGFVEGFSDARHHAFQDGYFVAGTWTEQEAGNGSEIEEYLYTHTSGAIRQVTPDGIERFVSADGYMAELGHDHAVIETPEDRRHIRVDDSGAEVRVKRDDGGETKVEVKETSVTIEIPDTATEREPDKTTRVKVTDDGRVVIGGDTEIGDPDARRIDPTSYDNETERYAEASGQARPIADVEQTDKRNPVAARMNSDLHTGFFDMQGFVFERRTDHPDPSVSDPTSEQYVDLPDGIDELPNWYCYVYVPEDTVYAWMDGAPVATPLTI